MGWDECDGLGQAAKLPVWEMCLLCCLCAKHLSKDAVTPSAAPNPSLPWLGWSLVHVKPSFLSGSHETCWHPCGLVAHLSGQAAIEGTASASSRLLGGCEGTLGEAAVLQVPVPGHSRLVNLWG